MTNIIISAPSASSGVNLFAPETNTNIGIHLKDLVQDNIGAFNLNTQNLIISLPTTATNLQLTSFGRYTDGFGSLWRMRNGTATDLNGNLKYATTYSGNFALQAGYDTFAISSAYAASGPLTHILSVPGFKKIPKAASLSDANTTAPPIRSTDNYTITGTAFNDTLTGAEGSDALLGNNGNDILVGGGGNDTLRGGLGADSLTGGGGADIIAYYSDDLADAGLAVDTLPNGDFTIGIDKIGIGPGLTLGTDIKYANFGDFKMVTNANDQALLLFQASGTLTDSDFVALT